MVVLVQFKRVTQTRDLVHEQNQNYQLQRTMEERLRGGEGNN